MRVMDIQAWDLMSHWGTGAGQFNAVEKYWMSKWHTNSYKEGYIGTRL